ncbi:hypothetical protein HED22_03975 [Thalassospira sp. HF15]|uniref:hypothetical protein n=1 Tax=Thalassospira sp. HF15 TaxID=2722755 RepID=UPI001431F49B|nr:hypothetical protein [Thalassospira sp. HF15]NIY74789.1 hypothetical protein [Thalassospira sp. HF15]
MAEWLPLNTGFDLGSFLGGSIAAGVAVGLFMLQRYVDQQHTRQRQLFRIRMFSIRAIENVENLLKRKHKDAPDMPEILKNQSGFPAIAKICKDASEQYDQLPEEVLEYRRHLTSESVFFVKSQLERIWRSFAEISDGGDLSKPIVQALTDIALQEEKIRLIITAIQLDSGTERWRNAIAERNKVTLTAPTQLIEDLEELEILLHSLRKLCQ